MRGSIIFLFVVLSVFSCKTPQNVPTAIIKEPVLSNDTGFKMPEMSVGFYNVENLFDIKDDPKTYDEDFTPTGKLKWTQKRYDKKLDQISKVIEAMGFPEIMGFCEVENAQVLKDLASTNRLKSLGYEVVHYESPDKRGIDNALMYQKEKFIFANSKTIRINFPKSIVTDYSTRDILIVSGRSFGQDISFLVNHWPSRRGGLEKSQPKRVYVASQVKAAVDSLSKITDNILIMGDFNDEPDNESILTTLGAGGKDSGNDLINLFYEKNELNEGTYNYRGNWNMLDQIIVSSKMTTKRSAILASKPEIVQKEWMIFTDKKYGAKPNRTYGGPNYYGGFSDHFPIKVNLLFQ